MSHVVSPVADCVVAALFSVGVYWTVRLCWGTERLWRRGAWYAVGVIVIAAAAWLQHRNLDLWRDEVAYLPLICLSTQTPLWMLRFLFRWRLVREDSGEARERWSIRDLGIGMAVVATALAAARWIGKPPDDPIIVAVMTALIALFFTPAAWYVLKLRRGGILAAIVHASLLGGAALLNARLILGYIDAGMAIAAAYRTAVLFCAVWAALGLLRWQGLRLVWRGEPLLNSPSLTSDPPSP